MIKLDYHLTREDWGKLLQPWVLSIQSFAQAADREKKFYIKKDKDNNIEFTNGIHKDLYEILSNEEPIFDILLFSYAKIINDSDVPSFLQILYAYTNDPNDKDHKNCFLMKKIFNYDCFKDSRRLIWERDQDDIIISKSEDCNNFWSLNKLWELLDVHTCTYCNLEYVYNVDTKISYRDIFEEPKPEDKITPKRGNKSKKAKDWEAALQFDLPQDLLLKGKKYKDIINEPHQYHITLDHIFSQEEYPFFSISPFNLVPVCTRCNSIKSDKIFPYSYYLYPFEYSFHDIAHFEFYFKNVECLSKPKAGSIIVKLVPNDPLDDKDEIFLKAKHICNLLGIKDRISQGHSDYICEILMKCIEYPRDYIFTLRESPYNISYKDIQRLIFGNYTTQENINKRPLAKVTIDMIRQYEHLFWTDKDEIDETFPSWN